jgi:hypothetical protein
MQENLIGMHGRVGIQQLRSVIAPPSFERTSLHHFDLGSAQMASFKTLGRNQPLFVQNNIHKNLWTGFHIVSAEQVLQGIVASTLGANVAQVEGNQVLIEQILQQLLQGSVSKVEQIDALR